MTNVNGCNTSFEKILNLIYDNPLARGAKNMQILFPDPVAMRTKASLPCTMESAACICPGRKVEKLKCLLNTSWSFMGQQPLWPSPTQLYSLLLSPCQALSWGEHTLLDVDDKSQGCGWMSTVKCTSFNQVWLSYLLVVSVPWLSWLIPSRSEGLQWIYSVISDWSLSSKPHLIWEPGILDWCASGTRVMMTFLLYRAVTCYDVICASWVSPLCAVGVEFNSSYLHSSLIVTWRELVVWACSFIRSFLLSAAAF